jgi:hypothetical protein
MVTAIKQSNVCGDKLFSIEKLKSRNQDYYSVSLLFTAPELSK